MSKVSFSKNKIWEVFIKAFTGEPELTVVGIDNQYITFKILPGKISDLFKDHESIKGKVIHGYSNVAVKSSFLTLNGGQVIAELIDPKFLETLDLNIGGDICTDDITHHIMTCEISANTPFQLKKEVSKFSDLQILFSDEKQITEVMLGDRKTLKEEDFTGIVSSYGKEVIRISLDNLNKKAKIIFNYGKLTLSAEEELSNKKLDVICDSENECKVNKHDLLGYAQRIFPSGVIFTKADNGKLQPILFQSLKADKPNQFQSTNFNFIVDVSGSMSKEMTDMKNKLVDLVAKAIEGTNNWTVSITPFDTISRDTVSFSSARSNLASITSYIKSLKVGDYTALYNTMHKVYNQEIGMASDKTNSVIFTLSDGGDNRSIQSEESVISKMKELRKVSPQSTMYLVGYAHYPTEFFDSLSSKTAAKTIHLDVISHLEELKTEIETINNCKVLYKFGSDQFAQCAAGDITIPSFTVDEDISINVAGESYAIAL